MRDTAKLVRTLTGVTPRSFLFGDAETFSSAMLRKKTEIFAEIWWNDRLHLFRKLIISPRGAPRQNLKNGKNKPAKFWRVQNLAGKANNAY